MRRASAVCAAAQGFEKPVRAILAHIPAAAEGPETAQLRRQTLLFTATWTDEVEAFGAELVREDVVRVSVGQSGESGQNLQVAATVDQRVGERPPL